MTTKQKRLEKMNFLTQPRRIEPLTANDNTYSSIKQENYRSRMLTFQDLQEVYDPNILKRSSSNQAVVTYVVKRTTGGLGMKIVNSDDAFEKLLKEGTSLKII